MTRSASPWPSRVFSFEYSGEVTGATGRSGAGNRDWAAATTPLANSPIASAILNRMLMPSLRRDGHRRTVLPGLGRRDRDSRHIGAYREDLATGFRSTDNVASKP